MKTITLFAALAGTCMAAVSTPAAAQRVQFRIGAGNLADALDAYTRQSGRTVIYRADEVRGARSAGFDGTAVPDAALRAILVGTGFGTRAGAGGSVAIVRSGARCAEGGRAGEPGCAVADDGPPATARAQQQRVTSFDVPAGSLYDVVTAIAQQSGSGIDIDAARTAGLRSGGVRGRYSIDTALQTATRGLDIQILNDGGVLRVYDNQDVLVLGRRASLASTISGLTTRTETPLIHTPATIDAVNEETLKTQNANSLADAIRNIPGAILTSSSFNRTTVFLGPDNTGGITFINGLRANILNANANAFDVSRVEVLKGPASVLTGAAVNGGAVNFVPKSAGPGTQQEITLGVGSGDEVRGSFDIGSEVGSGTGLFYRVLGFSQYADRLPGGENSPSDRLFAPSISLRRGTTLLNARFRYADQRSVLYDYYYFDTVKQIYAPYTGGINRDGFTDTRTRNIDLDGEQTVFAKGESFVKLRARANIGWGIQISSLVTPILSYLSSDGGAALLPNRYRAEVSLGRRDVSSYSAYADAYAKFATGPLVHQIIVGYDRNQEIIDDQSQFESLRLPDERVVPLIPALDPASPDYFAYRLVTKQDGIVVQDQIDWGRLHLLGALRQSWYLSDQRFVGLPDPSIAKASKLTGRVGGVVDIFSNLSLYASHSTSFAPNDASIRTVDGRIIPPQIRAQNEIGAKMLLGASRNFALAVTAYQFETNNSVATDRDNPGFSIPGPGQRGKGFQLGANGPLTPMLSIQAGYAYADARLSTGDRAPASPRHTANLWVVATPQLGDGQLTIGAGGNYFADFDTLRIRPFGIVNVDRANFSLNGALGYTLDQLNVNLTVDNILGRRNYGLFVESDILNSPIARRARLVVTYRL